MIDGGAKDKIDEMLRKSRFYEIRRKVAGPATVTAPLLTFKATPTKEKKKGTLLEGSSSHKNGEEGNSNGIGVVSETAGQVHHAPLEIQKTLLVINSHGTEPTKERGPPAMPQIEKQQAEAGQIKSNDLTGLDGGAQTINTIEIQQAAQLGINPNGMEVISGLKIPELNRAQLEVISGLEIPELTRAQLEGCSGLQLAKEGNLVNENTGLIEEEFEEEFDEPEEDFQAQYEQAMKEAEDNYPEESEPQEIAEELYPILSPTGNREYNSEDEVPSMESDPRDNYYDKMDMDTYCLQREFGVHEDQLREMKENAQAQGAAEVEVNSGEELLNSDQEDYEPTEESTLRRSRRILEKGGGVSYAAPKKTKKKRKITKKRVPESKKSEEELVIKALQEETINRVPLDEVTKNMVNNYCGIMSEHGFQVGQGSKPRRGAEEDGAAAKEGTGYKYHESAFEALEYDSEEELSDDESINLSD